MRLQLRCGLVAALLLWGPGCTSSDASNDRLTIFAAASLTEVFTELEPDARLNFAGSDQLAFQIEEGAPADVYASADARYAEALLGDELVEQPTTFATNRLVIIVPSDNPAGIEEVEDLTVPGVKVVVGAEGVPVGDYTRSFLATLDLSEIVERAVSHEQDVKEIVGKVALGEADAGFVYATDVGPVSDDVRAIELDPAAQPPIRYLVAVVSDTEIEQEAESFVQRLLGEEGREVLDAAGFGLP